MTKSPKKHKKDPYYKNSKINGYRARSAYKLIEIQKKYNIFKRAFYIVDLGCHPGSWLQVSKNYAEENLTKYKDTYYHRDEYKIMGVDIKKTSPIENIKIVKMDLTNPNLQNEIESYFKEKLDLIISDASIQKIGIKQTDSIMQLQLCDKILKLTKRNLKRKGNFLVKVFQGQDSDEFFKKLNSEFKFVKGLRPQSTKKRSNEIYIVCIGKY